MTFHRTAVALFFLMLGVALSGGILNRTDIADLEREWKSANPAERDVMRFGEFTAVIDRVKQFVPADATILLFSDVDPALFPYALFPRSFVQVNVDPETNRLFMDLPEPSYPPRNPKSINAEWLLYISPGNLQRGGDLQPLDRVRR